MSKAAKTKMGRPIKPPGLRKSRLLTVRVGAELREALEIAAKTSGKSLSREIEIRLGQSIARGKDPTVAALSGVIEELAFQVEGMHDVDAKPHWPWYSNPFMYRALTLAIQQFLDCLAPEGEIVPPIDDPQKPRYRGMPDGLLKTYESPEARATFASSALVNAMQSLHPSAAEEEVLKMVPENWRTVILRQRKRLEMARNQFGMPDQMSNGLFDEFAD